MLSSRSPSVQTHTGKAHKHIVYVLVGLDDTEKAFTDLKLTLQSTLTLGLPNPDRPFTQAVDEKGGYMT